MRHFVAAKNKQIKLLLEYRWHFFLFCTIVGGTGERRTQPAWRRARPCLPREQNQSSRNISGIVPSFRTSNPRRLFALHHKTNRFYWLHCIANTTVRKSPTYFFDHVQYTLLNIVIIFFFTCQRFFYFFSKLDVLNKFSLIFSLI